MTMSTMKSICRTTAIEIALFVGFLCISNPALTQNLDFARQTIDTLASPTMAGRGYTQDGHLKAAHFIKNEFQEFGVKPLNGEGYFQHFEVEANVFPGTVSLKVNGEQLQTGNDFQMDACSPAIEDEVKVLRFKPQWLTNQEKLGEALFSSKHEGKFLLVNETKLDLEEDEKEMYQKLKPSILHMPEVKLGGMVILKEDPLSWHISREVCERPVIEILKDSLPVRKIKKLDLEIEQELKTGIQTQNVLGLIEGTKYPDKYFVFSAHYDHIGEMGNTAYIPGANDDASGTAMMLDLARHYSHNPPEYSVVFMAFGGEELGILGSKYFTENPLIPLDNIRFMINMDIVGTGSEGITLVNGKVHDKAFNLINQINEENNYFPKVKARGKAANSDHHFFTEKGVPAFFIYTMGGISAYHDVFDRAETLPLTGYEGLFDLVTEFVKKYRP